MIRLLQALDYPLALFGLIFMSGTLTTYLTPPGAESSPAVQLLGAGIGLYAATKLMFTPQAVARVLGLHWPAVIPVAFAIASLAWTADIGLGFRRVGSLGLTTAFGFWLAFRFTPRQLLELLVLMAVITTLASFAVIMLNPTRGIHQIYEIETASHAGSWRGLFGHKNDFGRLMALVAGLLTLGFALHAGGRRLRWLLLPVMALNVLMIAKSHSSQAMALLASVPSLVLLFLWMRRATPTTRAVLVLLALPFLAMSVMSAQLLFEYVLGLLGRDTTLTGRTEIWEGVVLALGGHAALGGGYGSGWEIVGPRLKALTGIDVGHAHNGYLDLAADIGFVGVGLTVGFFLWLGALGFTNLMRGVRTEIAALAVMLVAFALIGNIAGSFFLRHNSLYWALPVALFAMLRDAPYARHRDSHAGRAIDAPLGAVWIQPRA